MRVRSCGGDGDGRLSRKSSRCGTARKCLSSLCLSINNMMQVSSVNKVSDGSSAGDAASPIIYTLGDPVQLVSPVPTFAYPSSFTDQGTI